MAVYDPAQVAGFGTAQQPSRCATRRLAEHVFDRPQSLDQAPLIRWCEALEDRTHLMVRERIEIVEGRTAPPGQAQQAPAGVIRARLALEQVAAPEAGEDPAEVAGIQCQHVDQVPRRGHLPLRQLVEHAGLDQRPGMIPQTRLKRADLTRVEAVEAPHRGHAHGVSRRHGVARRAHRCDRQLND
jgi:hypothetical protein